MTSTHLTHVLVAAARAAREIKADLVADGRTESAEMAFDFWSDDDSRPVDVLTDFEVDTVRAHFVIAYEMAVVEPERKP